MQLPEPQSKSFSSLLAGIEDGRIRIPQFQRNFVWSIQSSAAIVDSILKGYPIGTFILWHTKERLRSVRTIGGQSFREPPKSDHIDFVLDGQQRLTSLYACFKGLKIPRDERGGSIDDFEKIFVNLHAKDNEPIVLTDISGLDSGACISVKDLHEGNFAKFGKFPEKLHATIDNYRKRIAEYQYSVIQLRGAGLDVATEVFTRINVRGVELSLFEIMVAKTFDEDSGFDLSEKYDELIDSLSEVDYGTVSKATVLQTVSLIINSECKRENILRLDKKKFIAMWPEAAEAIGNAAEYFRGVFGIPVFNLLPYPALIAIFAYFFHRQKGRRPDSNQQNILQDFFWRVALAGRYSSAQNGKLAQDVRHMDEVLAGQSPDYKTPDWGLDISPMHIMRNGWFSAGRAYIKAILCLYAYHQPKSFKDNAKVVIGNDWLKQANSKNYHHFFPKSFLDRQGEDMEKINHILNITIVDDFLNKREIRAKPPSVYMRKFKRDNPQLAETMRTHLISDLDGFGVFEDDYDKFLNQRAKVVSEELFKRIIPNRMDGERQPDLDDYEENAG